MKKLLIVRIEATKQYRWSQTPNLLQSLSFYKCLFSNSFLYNLWTCFTSICRKWWWRHWNSGAAAQFHWTKERGETRSMNRISSVQKTKPKNTFLSRYFHNFNFQKYENLQKDLCVITRRSHSQNEAQTLICICGVITELLCWLLIQTKRSQILTDFAFIRLPHKILTFLFIHSSD